MARAQDQSRWERKAREEGRQRVAMWLSQEAVERLDELARKDGLRGRGEALERLLEAPQIRPCQ